MELAPIYLRHLGERGAADAGALEGELQQALTAARRAYPDLEVEPRTFVEHLARKIGRSALDPGWASELHVADLYLTCAALAGDRAALAVLDARVFQPAASATRRIGKTGDFVDEVHQRLRERLLLSEHQQPPRLFDYTGSGPLVSWAKVAAIRVALNLRPPPRPSATQDLDVLADPRRDPELSVIGRKNAARLSQAFREAAAILTDEERVLLRYHFADGLTFEQIAPLFQTHRSTISRRVAATRKKLLEETRRLLKERFRINTSEVSSLIREAKSRLDGSITAWLRAPDIDS
ncbi:MAG TPA: hypothetical protein VIG99_31150 [Myxococcaceae bacterium]